MKNTRNLSKPI